MTINGVACRAAELGVPVANVDTVAVQGATVTHRRQRLQRRRWSCCSAAPARTVRWCRSPGGHVDADPGRRARQRARPAPARLQVVNNPYAGNVISNAVSLPIGAALDISGVSQSGSTVTVNGSGFSPVAVINLFNRQGAGVANLGGFAATGSPRIPITVRLRRPLHLQRPGRRHERRSVRPGTQPAVHRLLLERRRSRRGVHAERALKPPRRSETGARRPLRGHPGRLRPRRRGRRGPRRGGDRILVEQICACGTNRLQVDDFDALGRLRSHHCPSRRFSPHPLSHRTTPRRQQWERRPSASA